VERKFEPVTVMVAPPVVLVGTMVGVRVMGPGTGLLTAMEATAEVPPPGAGLTAVSDRLPGVARSAVVRVTLTWVELT
jgi:hypothetical protein